MNAMSDRLPHTLLIRDASLLDRSVADVRVADGRIVKIGHALGGTAEMVIDAAGGLLLPGLHDHHIHIAATAASLASVRCGPPDVIDDAQLAAALGVAGEGWLRGIGYHESVAGAIDRHWLDRVASDRPVRVQHRSGRMWVFNTAGLERLLAAGLAPPPGLERVQGAWTGRLFDEDGWARRALNGELPDFTAVGSALARLGVTGVTEMSPANDDAVAAHFVAQRRSGALPQRVLLAGRPDLGRDGFDPTIGLGAVKLHLHEAHLPDFDATVALIGAAHRSGRVVAVHCVTLVELVFTLAAIREAGAVAGDRIEHGSIAPDAQIAEIAALGLALVVQPHFVAERGDAYLADIPASDWPHLYRLQAFALAGVTMAGGSDAPFGAPDPWAAMSAAVSRRTADGRPIGPAEALTPEQALALFLRDPVDLPRLRTIEVGARADMCLLAEPWSRARYRLSADDVRATIIDGRLAYRRIDTTPVRRILRIDAPV